MLETSASIKPMLAICLFKTNIENIDFWVKTLFLTSSFANVDETSQFGKTICKGLHWNLLPP